MGFVTGFTGGVTLTLGLAYLAVSSHERNRQSQADILRAQTRVVNTLVHDPSTTSLRSNPSSLLPPSRAELEAQRRSHFVETAKDKWNAEIEGAVRWAQTQDWNSVRESAEDTAARLLGVARTSAGDAATHAEAAAHNAQVATGRAVEHTRTSLEHTRQRVAERASHVETDTRQVLRQALDSAGAAAADAKGAVARTIERGVEKGHEVIEKGHEVVGKAKAAVMLAEERAAARADVKLLHVSDIEKALNERFEKRDDVMRKSVKEVLAERYTPIDKRDNSRLRLL
ncbi:hypothetical protein B0T17DRAFT_503152 [Bombardia bombarda]|uniref:MICOS complex subunit MIC12 n=1 Tax=Bombardia bombarda TaxID=252184 RepID=A0AA39XKF3_9PEZI|nr:hypothetical protein B0T17DRAFT_503152 [Bombardia bombarda]